jgi:hypothetical protein
MKRFLAFLLIASLAVTLWGCSQTPGSADTTGASAAEQTQTASTGTEAVVTVPTDTEEEPLQGEGTSVRSLRCVPGGGVIVSIVPCTAVEALVLCTADETGEDHILCRVDLKADQVLAQRDVGRDVPLGRRPNGSTVTVNYETRTLRLWDENLQRAEELPFPGDQGYYSQKEDRIYAVDGGTLTRMDFYGNTEELLSFRCGAKIVAVDPTWRRVLVRGLPSDDRADSANLLYTLDGTLLFREESDRVPEGFTRDGALLRGRGEAGKPGELAVCDPSGAHTAWALADGTSVFSFPGSGFLGMSEYSAAGGTTLSAVDTRSGSLSEIASYPDQRYVTFAWWAEAETLVVGVSGKGHAKLMLVEPAQMSATEQLTVATPRTEPPAEPMPTLSTRLKELRQRADRLEKTYGVRILFSNQAAIAPVSHEYSFIYTDAIPRGDESSLLAGAMEKLEAVLSAYPEGFFQSFRNYEDAAGIRILLVGDLVKGASSLDDAGVTYMTGGWYNIAMRAEGIQQSFLHRELWHAVEYRMEALGRPVDEAYWRSMNPEGFVYAGDIGSAQEAEAVDSEFILGATDSEQICCVSSDAVVDEREDRATLVAFLLSEETAPQDQRKFLKHYPLLQKKLKYLEERVSPLFGSAYWIRELPEE